MICETIKKGTECPFMTNSGCSFNGGVCHETVDQCDGCARAAELSSGWYCSACPDPSSKWKISKCNLATHLATTPKGNKTKINPLKASKRGR